MADITVKRFKDADRPAWLGYWFTPFGVALYLGPHIRELFGPLEPATLAALAAPLFVYFVFAFIDNGFVRATEGPNRYDPDPLARSVQAA